MARPRLFWTNLVPGPLPRKVSVDGILEEGWAPLWSLKSGPDPNMTFRTFLRPFASGAPAEFPMKWPRFPLTTYDERGLVYFTGASSEDLRTIEDLIMTNMRIRSSNLKVKGHPSVQVRGKVAKWIHLDGGSRALRPLSGIERERALGFPAGASAPQGSSASDWEREALTGNAFAVPVVISIAHQIGCALRGEQVHLRDGFPSATSSTEALRQLGASSTSALNSRR